MKTLKNSMQDFTAPFIEWESDHDNEVLQQDFVEAQLGESMVLSLVYTQAEIYLFHMALTLKRKT